jgi:hypothetical protein
MEREGKGKGMNTKSALDQVILMSAMMLLVM